MDGGTEVSQAAAPRYGEGRLRFGRLLASALKGRGMKQEDLAGMLGTTQSSVSGWINGKYEPAAETVFAIERTMAMDPGFLSRPLVSFLGTEELILILWWPRDSNRGVERFRQPGFFQRQRNTPGRRAFPRAVRPLRGR